MAFQIDLPASAHRHLEAAEALGAGKRRDVAGYLYGIATECAVKAMMRDAGLRPLPDKNRRDDPFFAHFPELRTLLRDAQIGRIGKNLMRFIRDDSFMTNWHVQMRYADGRQIKDQWVDTWAEQTRQVVSLIGT